METQMEAVECELKYSGVGVSALLVAAIATEGLLLATPLLPAVRAGAMAYVFLQAARAARSLLAIRALRLDERRAIEVVDQALRTRRGLVRDGSFVLPWLTVVRWRPEGAWVDRAILLVPGMASAEQLRKIRVMLRFT
jgi:hypothetical protein